MTFEFANFITKRFSTDNIENIINENPNRLIIAYQNGNIIGVVEIYDNTCLISKIAITELSKLYLLERFYGKVIGYNLMNKAEKEILKNGYAEFNLEVYINNERAISFYERQGDVSIVNVVYPIESNTYENLVMNKVLSLKNTNVQYRLK
nr:GNAT family N-acetyltransferase [Maribacter sp.]